MSYHDHDGGSGFHGQGRFAGIERLTPEVHESVEMPLPYGSVVAPAVVSLSMPEASVDSGEQAAGISNTDLRLARIWLGAFTAIGAVGSYIQFQSGNENWPATLVTTVVSGLATIGSLRIRE